jgi:hypothetical protein
VARRLGVRRPAAPAARPQFAPDGSLRSEVWRVGWGCDAQRRRPPGHSSRRTARCAAKCGASGGGATPLTWTICITYTAARMADRGLLAGLGRLIPGLILHKFD